MLYVFYRRKNGEEGWCEITEQDMHNFLYMEYLRNSPLIRVMVNGDIVESLGYEYKMESVE